MIVRLTDAQRVQEAIQRAETMSPEELDQYIDQVASRRQELQTILDKLAASRRTSKWRFLEEGPSNVVPFAKPQSRPDDGGVA